MGDDILKGQWKQLKGSIKEKWGKITDNELDQINGQAEQLVGRLQEKYGYSKKQAEENLNQFLKGLKKEEKMESQV